MKMAGMLNELIRLRRPTRPPRHPIAIELAKALLGSYAYRATQGCARWVAALHCPWRLIYLTDLLRELVTRDMKVRYKGSTLGVIWSLMNPLMQLLVFHFIFRLVLQLNIPRYSSFAFSGMLAWNWFQASLLDASGSMINSRELIKRPGFPVVILPVVSVTTQFIYFLLALPILVLFLIIGGNGLYPMILVLPVVMAVQFVLTLSLGYLAAMANIMFRDAHYLLGVSLQLLFFLTPVFYDAGAVPQRYQTLYHLNPMAQLVIAYRGILIEGKPPDWFSMLALTGLAGGLLCIGLIIFRRASYRFAEEV
jgi:lipopolysaccharide transport system permease protein